MNPMYSELLKNAWRIIWRHKYLWFFGLFLVWIGQEIEIMIRNYDLLTKEAISLSSWQELFKSGFGGLFTDFWNVLNNTSLGGVFTTILFVIALLIIVWLTIVSVGAIIYSTAQYNDKKSVTYNQSFGIGQKYFWKNFIIQFVARIADYAFLLIAGLIVSILFVGLAGDILSWLLIILTFIVSLIIAFVAKYASCYIVLKNQSVNAAMRSAWKLFIKNILPSIEMAVIMFFVSFVVGLALLLVLVLITVPFLLLVFIFNQSGTTGIGTVFLYLLSTIVILITIVVGSMVTGYQFSGWTLLFLRLTEGKKVSKIVQWVERISGKKVQPKTE